MHPGPFLSSLELTAERQREGALDPSQGSEGVDPLSQGAAKGELRYSRGQ